MDGVRNRGSGVKLAIELTHADGVFSSLSDDLDSGDIFEFNILIVAFRGSTLGHRSRVPSGLNHTEWRSESKITLSNIKYQQISFVWQFRSSHDDIESQVANPFGPPISCDRNKQIEVYSQGKQSNHTVPSLPSHP